MSKSSLKLHSLFAGLALAVFLSGCDLIDPVAAQGLAPAPIVGEATFDQPDHP